MATKFEKDMIEGMRDALDHASGLRPGTWREHVVLVPDARAIRAKLKMSQSEFAKTYRIPLATLKGWEQGRRRPDAPASALLQVIAAKPQAARDALKLR